MLQRGFGGGSAFVEAALASRSEPLHAYMREGEGRKSSVLVRYLEVRQQPKSMNGKPATSL